MYNVGKLGSAPETLAMNQPDQFRAVQEERYMYMCTYTIVINHVNALYMLAVFRIVLITGIAEMYC